MAEEADLDDIAMRLGAKLSDIRAALSFEGPRTRRALGSLVDGVEEVAKGMLSLRRERDALLAENEALKAELAKHSSMAIQVNVGEVRVGELKIGSSP